MIKSNPTQHRPRKLFYGLILTAFMLLGLASCEDEYRLEDGAPKNNTVQFTVEVPGMILPETRSMDGEDEAYVNEIVVLVFDNTPSKTLVECVPATITSRTSTPVSGEIIYRINFKASIGFSTSTRTIGVVANASQLALDELTQSNGAAQPLAREAALQKLIHTETAIPIPSYIPMYGEITVPSIAKGITIPANNDATRLQLERMYARIDVTNSANNFQLTDIFLVNANTKGYVAPIKDSGNKMLIPPGSERLTEMEAKAIHYPYGLSGAGGYTGKIYTFESFGASKSTTDVEAKKATCIIIKGTYKSETYYYRIDFTTPDKTSSPQPHEVTHLPVYRNHQYKIVINEVNGVGYTGFEEAYQSRTVPNNLKVFLHVIDYNALTEFAYNGQYYLGAAPVHLQGDENCAIIPVETNWPDGWEIDNAVYPGGIQYETSPPQGEEWTREIEATPTTNPTGIKLALTYNYHQERGAWIHIKTVRDLKLRIRVVQQPTKTIAPHMARSNVLYKDNKLTFAVNQRENASMPAHSQGLFFKWGSLIGLSPAGTSDQPNSYIVFNPSATQNITGTGLAGWDNIPYAHSKFNYVNGTGPDEFRKYENGKGYNETKGTGDICRYISEQSGWVTEGYWRLPTYGEMVRLATETQTKGGDFKNITSTLSETVNNHKYGLFNPASGWWIGTPVYPSSSLMANPPHATSFLPVSGHRYPDGQGKTVQVGYGGYYWTSTRYDNITTYYYSLTKKWVMDFTADRSYGYPIRCIRDY